LLPFLAYLDYISQVKKPKKGLAAAQRLFLRTIVPGYRTTATVAFQVIAGIAPLQIEALAISRAFTLYCPDDERASLIRDWGELLRILNSDVTIYVDYSGDLNQIGMTEGTVGNGQTKSVIDWLHQRAQRKVKLRPCCEA